MKAKPIFFRVFNSKLTTQLIMSFLGMIFIITSISSVFIYTGIVNMLKDNQAENSIKQFKQYEYNISSFCEQVDLISRQLVIDADLQSTGVYKKYSDVESQVHAVKIFKIFSKTMSNFKYVDSIIYYSADGITMKSTKDQNIIVQTNEGEEDPIYNLDKIQLALSNKARITWFGGLTDVDFKIPKRLESEQDTKPMYYITAARSLSSKSKTGLLIINVDMNYFTSIYNYLKDSEAEETYIIDNTGRIISHTSREEIGKQSDVYERINWKSSIDNLTITEKLEKKQIISYKLKAFDWILVNEVPVKFITRDIKNLRNIIIIMFVISLLIALSLSRYWIYKITGPLNILTTAMKKMEQGRLGLTLKNSAQNELGILIDQFNSMSKSIQELVEQNEIINDEKRRIEIEALQSQINPHFIYNTINSVKWMAVMIEAEGIAESLTALGDLLSPVFRKHDILCPISEEIDYVTHYVKLMNFRFAGAFKLKLDLREDLMEFQILRFVLQPLVENAIYHGLNQGSGEIRISLLEENGEIVLRVTDNGSGMDRDRLSEMSASLVTGKGNDLQSDKRVGLVNVNRRIKLHFGDNYGIELSSIKNRGTDVKIRIPKVQKKQS